MKIKKLIILSLISFSFATFGMEYTAGAGGSAAGAATGIADAAAICVLCLENLNDKDKNGELLSKYYRCLEQATEANPELGRHDPVHQECMQRHLISPATKDKCPNCRAILKIPDSTFIAILKNNNKYAIKALLDAGANPYVIIDGQPALIWAAAKGHKDTVDALLANGKTDPNLQSEDGATALMLATQEGHEDIVKKLLAKDNTDLNLQNKEGNTALMFAVHQVHKNIVDALLDSDKTDPNKHNQHGNTALMFAAHNGHKDIFQKLLQNSTIKIGLKNKRNKTALDFATEKGNTEIIKMLQEAEQPFDSRGSAKEGAGAAGGGAAAEERPAKR